MYYGMPVQQQYMDETVRIQITEVVIGTVKIQQFEAELRPYVYSQEYYLQRFLRVSYYSSVLFC